MPLLLYWKERMNNHSPVTLSRPLIILYTPFYIHPLVDCFPVHFEAHLIIQNLLHTFDHAKHTYLNQNSTILYLGDKICWYNVDKHITSIVEFLVLLSTPEDIVTEGSFPLCTTSSLIHVRSCSWQVKYFRCLQMSFGHSCQGEIVFFAICTASGAESAAANINQNLPCLSSQPELQIYPIITLPETHIKRGAHSRR